MLLKGYRLELFQSHRDAKARVMHCHAHLDDDVSSVLPYLNAELGGVICFPDPPSLTLKNAGKSITIHPRLIAINGLCDDQEAGQIMAWLQREINAAWRRRAETASSVCGTGTSSDGYPAPAASHQLPAM
jgi:ArsR family metal-binding transcriptional regulator